MNKQEILKLAHIIIAATVLIAAGCTDSGSSGHSKGFSEREPYDETDNIFDSYYRSEKQYTVSNTGQSCGPDVACNVIAFNGKFGKTRKFGIAFNNSHTLTPPDFSVKIYFNYTSISEGTTIQKSSDDYTISILYNGRNYTEPAADSSGQLDITLTSATTDTDPADEDKSNDLYTIVFNKSITVTSPETESESALTQAFFASGDTIIANKY